MFSKIDNLSRVIRVMRELAIDGLHHSVVLATNSHGAHQVNEPAKLAKYL